MSGPSRNLLDMLTRIASETHLTLEEVADVMDAWVRIAEEREATETTSAVLATWMPSFLGGIKH